MVLSAQIGLKMYLFIGENNPECVNKAVEEKL